LEQVEWANSSRLTFGPALNNSAVWSPDDTRLIFRTNRNGLIDLYQKSAAGGGNEEPVLLRDVARAAGIETISLALSDWSRKGDVIFSAPMVGSGYDLGLLSVTGDQKPVRFIDSPSDQLHGNFSPDGRFVAYSSNESGRFEVHVQTFPKTDSKWQISTNGGYEPRWRGDGREIYYLSGDGKLVAVSVSAGPSFGVPMPLFQTRVLPGVTSFRTHYVPSRDGRRFLVNTQSDEPGLPITVVLNWTAGLKK